MIDDKKQEELKLRLLKEHHDAPHPGLEGGRLRIHVALHAVVEFQLLDGVPPQTRETLERLVNQGMSHHEAVHAIADVVSDAMTELMEQEIPFDEERYAERLAGLSPPQREQKN